MKAAAEPDPAPTITDILHSSPIGISISRVSDGHITDMNDEFLRILGFTRAEVVGHTSHELGLWVEPGQRERIVHEFLEKGRCTARPVPMRRKDGTVITVLFSASPLLRGKEAHTIAWVLDITDRLRIEEDLRVSEGKWRTLVESAPVTILTLDRAGTILTSNRSQTGRAPADLVGRCIHDFTADDEERRRSVGLLGQVFATGEPVTFEIESFAPDGRRMRMRNVFAPLVSGGQVTTVIGVGMDVTVEEETAEALRASEARWRALAENAPAIIIVLDRAGRAISLNRTVTGRPVSEYLGQHVFDFLRPDHRDRGREHIERVFTSGAAESGDYPIVASDDSIWWFQVRIAPFPAPGGEERAILVATDITARRREEEERLRMEAEMHQARRVESLGILAGGIAHDFNNILTAILGSAELALAGLPADSVARPLVEQIQRAGTHASELTRQMLAYTGRGQVVLERMDLSAIVREMAQLLAASIPKKARLAFETAEGLGVVEGDTAQLRQVVLNLVINAADALGDGGGTITVRTGAEAAAAPFRADLVLGSLAPDRQAVFFEVEDNGSGVDHSALPRIFDPFFTTKFTGRGLGLAAVQGIVLRHHGAVAVRSTPGAGSTFRVSLPAAEGGAAGAPLDVADPGRQMPWRGSGTLLVVDDEDSVLQTTSRMLRSLGFEILAARDGREALEVIAANPQIRTVLLDLTMPRMDGRETFRELRRLHGSLPVVLCSGYDVRESAERFPGMDLAGYLQKPYRLDGLIQVVRRALGE